MFSHLKFNLFLANVEKENRRNAVKKSKTTKFALFLALICREVEREKANVGKGKAEVKSRWKRSVIVIPFLLRIFLL